MKQIKMIFAVVTTLLLLNVCFAYSDNGFTEKWLAPGRSKPQITISLKKGEKAKTFICVWIYKQKDKGCMFRTKNGWWGWEGKSFYKQANDIMVRSVVFHSMNYVATHDQETAIVMTYNCSIYCRYEDEP